MKRRKSIKFFLKTKLYNQLYYLYINTLIGKFIKKCNRFIALKIYKNIKENIKLQTNKKKEISFIFFFAMLNSMPKVAFKEIRLGSQKKDIPISISEKKQVLISVETLLKTSKIKKKVEFNKLVECIISSYKNKGIIIKNKQMKYRKAIINKMLLNVYKSNKLEREIKKYVSKKSNFKIFKNKTAL